MRFRPRIFHPLLLSIYPVLFLFSRNIAELRFSELVLPLVFVVILGILLWAISLLVLRNKDKAALEASAAILMIFLFKHGYQIFLALLGDPVLKRRYFLLLWLLLFAMIMLLIARTKKDLSSWTHYANLLSVILILLACLNILVFYARPKASRFPKLDQFDLEWAQEQRDSGAQKKPDVYYIILDGYGGAAEIKKHYAYENAPFLEKLRSKGFTVIDQARSNYSFTHESISSSLSLDYIHSEQSQPSRQQLANPVKHSRVAKIFRALGYRYVLIPSGFYLTNQSPLADVTINTGVWVQSQLVSLLIESSVVWFTANWTSALNLDRKSKRESGIYKGEFQETGIMWQWHQHLTQSIKAIARVAKAAAPTFTFAHVICPHPPYVFNADGTLNAHSKMADLGALDDVNYWHLAQPFIGQLTHLNQLLEEMITEILASSAEPPIIILQGDHGTAFSFGRENDSDSPTNEMIHERMSILLACLAPNAVTEKLYERMTPVNIFRIVLNESFGASFPLLPDKNYWSFGRPIVDVTSQANE